MDKLPDAFHDHDFWQDLGTGLTVTGDEPLVGTAGSVITGNMINTASDMMDQSGYLVLPPVIPADLTTPVAFGIERLVDAQIPPVFIYMFDEPWQVFREAQELIARFLTNDYRILPNFWAWYIPAKPGAAGWPLHRDSKDNTAVDHGPVSQLVSMSLWIPLSNVSEDSAVMNVLPLDSVGRYPAPPETPDEIRPEDQIPLPANAGSILGWRQDVLHWSSPFRSENLPPRISLSFEFQNPFFEPLAEPLIDPENPPGFVERLDILSDQFRKYRHIAD